MLRSLLPASSAAFVARSSASSPLGLCKAIRFGTASSLILCNLRGPGEPKRAGGSMAEVLEILGPFHLAFPTSEVRLYVRLLKKCIRSHDSFMGSLVHAHVLKSGLGQDLVVSNVLLDMYAKAAAFDCCSKLFDEMPERDVISWCTLLSGFVGRGFHLEAFQFFRAVYQTGLMPNCFVMSSVLKACAGFGILEQGLMVHGLVIKCGLVFDRFVEIGLVDVYAKCGNVDGALKLFYEIPVKSQVAWNAMISGYVQNGFFVEGAKLCRDMCRVGLFMDLVTLRVVANAASILAMIEFCKNLHVYSIKMRLNSDTFVVAEMVRLLVKLGKIDYMAKLFCEVKRPDSSLYSLIISGYQLYGYREEAVELVEEILASCSDPREGDLVTVFNQCLCRQEGTQIHARVIKTGHFSYLSVGNALITMYAKFGQMVDADTIFQSMQRRDVISWTAIMAGFAQNLQFEEALETFKDFIKAGIPLDHYCAVTLVNACTGLQNIHIGKQINSLVFKLGFLFSDLLAASLVHMYAKCGYIEDSARLFSYSTCLPSLALTNVMLSGYCWNSQPDKALLLFSREHQHGLISDQFTYSMVLGACADIKVKEAGEQIHCCVVKRGLEYIDMIIGNAIMNLYVECGYIASACKFFYSMERRNTSSYAILMAGYLQNRCSSDALNLFSQMQKSGLHANPVTFARILRGCADLSAIDLGRQVHASIIKMGFVFNAYIENALVGMYEKIRDMDDARGTAYEMLRDHAECDSKNAGYSQVEDRENTLKAIGLFRLNKAKEDYYFEDVRNPYKNTACRIYETPLPLHIAQSEPYIDLSLKKLMNHSDKEHRILQPGFNGVIARDSVVQNYVNYRKKEDGCGSAKLFLSTQEIDASSNQVLLVIFFGDSHLKILEGGDESLKFVRTSRHGVNGETLCMPA